MGKGDEGGTRGRNKGPLSGDHIRRMKEDLVYGVGYGRPPEHSRFQKGQSGNPNGRPRSKLDIKISPDDLPTHRAILDGMRRTVRVREGDTVSEMSMPDALVRSLHASALKGDPRSLRLAMDIAQAHEQQHAAHIAEQIQWAENYKEKASQAIAAAHNAGKVSPPLLPHPDDVIIEEGVGFRIAGPIDEEEQKQLEETLRFRDALLMQHELDTRLEPPAGANPGRAGGALLFAIAMNQSVPKRYRLEDTEMTVRLMTLQTRSKRALLKEVYRAWQSLGRDVPRGKRFMSVERAQALIAFGLDTIAALQDGRLDGGRARSGAMDQKTERFLGDWIERVSDAPQ